MNKSEYKVQILHYLNPHLMWALVDEGENNVHFEQIGIYGIMPLNIEIDFEGNVTTSRSRDWLPAVFIAMKKVLMDASEVLFSVSFIDNTTSIFDDNVHKYGNLTVKMKNGKTVSLLEKLLDTGLVDEDITFQNNLSTKLDYVATTEVYNKIKRTFPTLGYSAKVLDSILNEQMSTFQQKIKTESSATRDLDTDVHQTYTKLSKKQINDLNACKDIEEVSAGRACNTKGIGRLNMGLMKKLDAIKSQSTLVDFTNGDNDFIDKDGKENIKIKRTELDNEWEDKDLFVRKPKQVNRKPASKDTKNKTLVAFGPPGLKPTEYHFIEVKEEEIQNKMDAKRTEETVIDDSAVKQDMYEKADSEINFKISNLNISKLTKTNNIENNRKIANENGAEPNIKASKDIAKENGAETSVKSVNSVKQKTTSTNRKMQLLKRKVAKLNESASTTDTDSVLQPGDNSDSESITSIVNKLDISIKKDKKDISKDITDSNEQITKTNVNPFKNLDGSKSVFVDKLIRPTLMVHTKLGNCIQPISSISEIPFGTDIHIVLRNMSINKPMRLQTVSWPTILRGHSLFLVSPCNSGKTVGYLPAVCRLVSDYRKYGDGEFVPRLTCIIVCGTAYAVSHVEELSKMLMHDLSILACYEGMSDVDISTSILNGCDILVVTPTLLVRILRQDLGLDLRNLKTLVIDDCERVSEVYQLELKFCLFKVKEMLKIRANKEVKVQYIVASRIWCDFMSSLAKKAPDSVVCIGGFQECVLYSEVNTTVEFLNKDCKIDAVIKFLDVIDKSRKTVIACRSDDEVQLIEKELTKLKYVVFACNSTMTVQDLYNIDLALADYKEPVSGPILVCCDGNLTHINLTDANYLIHYSLPELFSTFCKRFAVLTDNYSSIFVKKDTDVKIKVFLDSSNVEQIPKILHFIKRCTENVPANLDQISSAVVVEKDLKKAEMFVPLCNELLILGQCPDVWNCRNRHNIFQDYDKPKSWLPNEGIIAFKILHFHSAVHYSARILSCTTNNEAIKYPETYSSLSFKLGMHFSRESNKKLHGIAKPGDICAVALKQNLFARCKVVKILKHSPNNIPCLLYINLIDEEKYEMARDTCLYHLPDNLKYVETHVAKVILANLVPQSKDVSYSKLADKQIKAIIEGNDEIYVRGRVSLVINNFIFVDSLEACEDLSSLKETVVKNNIRNELLEDYAVNNPDHIKILKKLGENVEFMQTKDEVKCVTVAKPIKVRPKVRWAHLESDVHAPVYYLYAKSPELFFVQHVKFQDCINILLKDIKKYISDNPEPVVDVSEGDIVLAVFPDDGGYERARVDKVLDNDKVKCFFFDLGDWRIVSIDKLLSMPEKIITQLPFQAIECRLVGIRPLGNEWSEFSTNWLVDQFYDSSANLKYLFAKRYTKEKAEFTDGGKYGIALINTYDNDVCINTSMLEANLADENDETELLNTAKLEKVAKTASSDDSSDVSSNLNKDKEELSANTNNTQLEQIYNENDDVSKAKASTSTPKTLSPLPFPNHVKQNIQENQLVLKSDFNEIDVSSSLSPHKQMSIMNFLKGSPIRSVPLVDDDDLDDDRWDSVCPALMLTNPGTHEPIVEVKEPKIIPLAIQDVPKMNENEIKNDEEINGSETKIDEVVINGNWQRTTNILTEVLVDKNTILLQDDTSSEKNNFRLNWGQDKNSVVIKIEIKTKSYDVLIDDKEIEFRTIIDNKGLGFVFELQGIVDVEKSTHVNKLDHIEINLNKVMKKNWLKLISGDVRKVTCIKNNDVTKDIKTNEKCQNIAKIDPVIDTKAIEKQNNFIKNDDDKLRKPKLVWRQNLEAAVIKILIITDKYEVKIKDRSIKFYANANDEEYGFKFELYGLVDVEKSHHSNKGQYIQINLKKIMPRLWLILSKGYIKKWITYDVDNIDVMSDEENETNDDMEKIRANLHTKQDSDSDDDFIDDSNFGAYSHR